MAHKTSTATLNAPATASVGQQFEITGTGYTPGSAWVLVETSTVRAWGSATVDGAGMLTFDWTLWEPGAAKLSAWQNNQSLASTSIMIG